MQIRRRLFVAAVATLFGGLVAGGPAAAEQKVMLNPEIRQRLMALEPLRGPGVDRALFDGRPLLVTFFASW